MKDFKLFEGFCFMTDKWTDICDCRVAFATEKFSTQKSLIYWNFFVPFRRFLSISPTQVLHILGLVGGGNKGRLVV